MALSARDRRAVMVGLALIGLGLLARFIVVPGLEHWRDVRAVMSDGTARLMIVEQKIKRRDAVVDRQRQRFGQAVGQPLATIEEVRVSFPKTVQQALGQAGLGVSSIELQGVRKLREAPGVSLVSLRVRGMCGAPALPQALEALRSAEQLVIVDRFEIGLVKSDSRDQWSVTLVVSTPAIQGGGL